MEPNVFLHSVYTSTLEQAANLLCWETVAVVLHNWFACVWEGSWFMCTGLAVHCKCVHVRLWFSSTSCDMQHTNAHTQGWEFFLALKCISRESERRGEGEWESCVCAYLCVCVREWVMSLRSAGAWLWLIIHSWNYPNSHCSPLRSATQAFRSAQGWLNAYAEGRREGGKV